MIDLLIEPLEIGLDFDIISKKTCKQPKLLQVDLVSSMLAKIAVFVNHQQVTHAGNKHHI